MVQTVSHTGAVLNQRAASATGKKANSHDIGDPSDRVEFTLEFVQSAVTEAAKLTDPSEKISELTAARDLLREVIDLSPGDPRLRFQAGILGGHMGDFNGAVADLRQAVLLNSGDKKGYLAMLGILSGRLNETSSQKISKAVLEIQSELALGHAEKAWNKALMILNKSLQRNTPPDSWSLNLARLASIGAGCEMSYLETLNNLKAKYPESINTGELSIPGFDVGSNSSDTVGGEPSRSNLSERGAVYNLRPINDTTARVTYRSNKAA